MIRSRQMRRGRHRRNGQRSLRIVVLTLLVLGLAFSGTAYAGYRYDLARADRILPGVSIDGVDVGWLTRDEAISALRSRVEDRLGREIEVQAGGATLTVTPGDLGSAADVAAAVDDALDVSHSYSWVSRVLARLWNRPVGREVPIAYQHDEASVAAWLERVAGERNVSPRSASVDWIDDHVAITRSRQGRALKRALAAEAVLKALDESASAFTLPFKRLAPAVTEETLGHTIVVRTGVNKLMLFDGLKMVKEYAVATGTPGYPTPHGHFEIINKRMNPTWVNPAPNGWGASLPASIGPGPGNPLGTRALDLDAPGIRIHGTYADDSIGSWASHGCIRMHIPESEELFGIVDVGTSVVIV